MKMHISLYVKDIDKTVEFYNKFFEQDAAKVKEDYAKYDLDNPGLIISFVKNESRVNPDYGHLGFVVESLEQVKDKMEKVKQNGLEVLEEFGTNCCYANQDKFWVTDPDGNQWEVYSFNSDVEFNDPKYAEESASACCSPQTLTQIEFK